jgi:hypothetical protein
VHHRIWRRKNGTMKRRRQMWCHNEGNYSLMSNFFPNGR